MSINVLKNGLQTTVQDLGRNGYAHFGISASGAADALSLRIGNLLVGNPGGSAGLELTMLGGTYLFNAEAFITISGSLFEATIDGKAFPHQEGVYIHAGQTLAVGPTMSGARCYLCVRGGIDVPVHLSSKTTHVVSGIGGHKGRSIQKGDMLNIGNMNDVSQPILLKEKLYIDTSIMRITSGLQSDWFSDDTWSQFTSKPFTVSELSNRMGIRLEGKPIHSSKGNEILTEGIPLGAVQLPGNGQPIISFVEHQTTGGYPKIANVITADLCKVGQLKPGDRFTFQQVTIEEAETLRLKQESYVQKLKNAHD